jgi:hypothetical protein
MEYREQGKPFDDRLRQLSNAAVEEERQQDRQHQRRSK